MQTPTGRRALAAGLALAAAGAAANTMNPPAAPARGTGRFAGRVVAITGGTYGIGEATARAFAREGALVGFCGRTEELGRRIAEEVGAAGGQALYVRADVRREEQVRAFLDATAQRFGRLDVLFNNAGYFMDAAGGQLPSPVDAIGGAHWAQMIETNVNGVLFGMKHAIPRMRAQGAGVIINNASVSAHRAFAGMAAYAASKHAVLGLTKVAALENADANIRIVSLSPLAVDTPMLRASFRHFGIDPVQAASGMVTKRIMTAEEMARAVMFLASDDATCITAADLDVTGGHLAR